MKQKMINLLQTSQRKYMLVIDACALVTREFATSARRSVCVRASETIVLLSRLTRWALVLRSDNTEQRRHRQENYEDAYNFSPADAHNLVVRASHLQPRF